MPDLFVCGKSSALFNIHVITTWPVASCMWEDTARGKSTINPHRAGSFRFTFTCETVSSHSLLTTPRLIHVITHSELPGCIWLKSALHKEVGWDSKWFTMQIWHSRNSGSAPLWKQRRRRVKNWCGLFYQAGWNKKKRKGRIKREGSEGDSVYILKEMLIVKCWWQWCVYVYFLFARFKCFSLVCMSTVYIWFLSASCFKTGDM